MMGFGLIYGDITKANVDVIVNSLGLKDGITTYGRVCNAIISAAHNPQELKNKINKAKDVYSLGEYFFSDNYGLPCKKILHLITPYYSDDPKLVILQDCLRRILYECYERGYKSIAIPALGTISNKYNEDDVANLIKKMGESFADLFKVNVFFVRYKKEFAGRIIVSDEEIEQYSNERALVAKASKMESKRYFNVPQPKNGYTKTYFMMDFVRTPSENIIFADGLELPVEYANSYSSARYSANGDIIVKYINARVRAFLGYGAPNPRDAGSKYLSAMTKDSEIDKYYIMILALKMEYEEAIGFLNYFGKTIPNKLVDPRANVIVEIIKKHIYDLYEIDEYLTLNKQKRLFQK